MFIDDNALSHSAKLGFLPDQKRFQILKKFHEASPDLNLIEKKNYMKMENNTGSNKTVSNVKAWILEKLISSCLLKDIEYQLSHANM